MGGHAKVFLGILKELLVGVEFSLVIVGRLSGYSVFHFSFSIIFSNTLIFFGFYTTTDYKYPSTL